MSNNSAYANSDNFNQDFTDEDAFMLIRIATSPEHRLHTCQWVDNTTSCRNDISGQHFPTHLRERHGITNADNRVMKCRWDGCREYVIGTNMFPHIQQKHIAWMYACYNCGMEFPRQNMRNAHFNQCRDAGA
ncbi:hypothetical protein EDD16DRAFT_1527620 [Pisolithus croceorrhizus]|nr:hypothetical protein EDD16DRAFT_1527620 [Pisolithus croceorrhizus]KAI6100940.1 hypothetical protein EV401DRAFT_1894347 [Pisolithus croceorrhizus]KAI6118086.1 hypothetical protein F5141DRAFT_1061751 [Pisolithus sp. B1]KAI6161577.1 hypothetical protein EDD17DRAFT_1509093 [Pisolithus thermaeus]